MPGQIQSISFTNPYSADEQAIERQRQMALLLQQQAGTQIPTNRMVGRVAIPINPMEGIAKLAQGYSGTYQQNKADERQKELADRYQSDLALALRKAGTAQTGTPATAASEDAAGNYMPEQAAGAPNRQAMIEALMGHPATQPLALQQMQQDMQRTQRLQMMADVQKMAGGQASGAGTPFEGVPPQIVALMTSGDPELAALGKSMMEAQKGIAQRAGAPVVNPFTGRIIAQPTPQVPPGVALQVGPGGPAAYPVPGAIPAMAATTQAQAAAGEAGKAPYQLETLNTEGAPTLMTREQAIQAATGQPMPQPARAPIAPIRTTAPSEAAALQQFNTGGGAPRTVEIQPPQRAPGLRLQDQGAGAEQREFGKSLGEYTAKTQTEAANAAVANRFLDNIEHEGENIRLGKLAPAQSSLIQWGQALGLPVSEESKQTAGSIQALSSMAIKMAGAATRASDAQPSQLQFLKTLESMPTAERSAEGFQKITAYLRDMNNYNITKHQYLQQWRGEHNGSAEGFEAKWPSIANSLPFIWNQQKRVDDLKNISRSTPQSGGRVKWSDLP